MAMSLRDSIPRATTATLAAVAVALLLLIACGGRTVAPMAIVTVSPNEDLQTVIDQLRRPTRLELSPGTYHFAPSVYNDPACGNCDDPDTPVAATRGLRVHGAGIELVGSGAEQVTLHTHAGYGILFDHCDGCRLAGVTITGGIRDPDPWATDGAVVVRRGHVTLEHIAVRDNLGDPATVAETVVGIAGVVGREGAEIDLRDSRIEHGSWDGVALYRDARATIRDNVIDGVETAPPDGFGGGRGVGIGLTWNARATVEGNLVRRYWKGIGIFVDAEATVRENVLQEIVSWGISLWDATRGRAAATIADNVIDGTGACGVALFRGESCGEQRCAFTGNVLVRTGLDPTYDAADYFCRQQALANDLVPADFVIAGNAYFANRERGGRPGHADLPWEAFREAVAPLIERLRTRPALGGAHFLRDLDRGLAGH